MVSIKPIQVWTTTGPNPPKVLIVLEELELPYETVTYVFGNVKSTEYLDINPNGRMPSIHDPNTELTLWESGAIIEYLIEKYDTNHKLSYVAGSKEAYLSKQWLHFQISGQGPYYGQAVWFKNYHHEHLQSAFDRYLGEIKRVTSVLDSHLKKQREEFGGEPWLVGDRMTYADMAFIPYQILVPSMLSQDLQPYCLEQFEEVSGWLARMKERPSVAKLLPRGPN